MCKQTLLEAEMEKREGERSYQSMIWIFNGTSLVLLQVKLKNVRVNRQLSRGVRSTKGRTRSLLSFALKSETQWIFSDSQRGLHLLAHVVISSDDCHKKLCLTVILCNRCHQSSRALKKHQLFSSLVLIANYDVWPLEWWQAYWPVCARVRSRATRALFERTRVCLSKPRCLRANLWHQLIAVWLLKSAFRHPSALARRC